MDIEELRNELGSEAVKFYEMTLNARKKAKRSYRDNEKTADNGLRLLIDGLLSRTALYMTRKVEKADETISYQIGLSASFVRSHHVVMDLILEGSYVEADILIRKQLESLARMIELDLRPIADLIGKTPNVGCLQKWGLGRMYGLLNKTVHFAHPETSHLLVWEQQGERFGPSILPMYSEQGYNCFARAVAVAIPFFFWVMEKCEEWYDGFDKAEMESVLVPILLFAVEADILQEEK